MLSLDASAVRLGASAENKTDAIRQVGQILIDSGYIEPGYVDSLLAREKVANTFLGNGIAIPHGVPKDRGLIKRTGVAVLQVPDGVDWNPGDRVYLVVGIAAKSDEHLQILTNLTDVLGDPTEAERLAHTHNPVDIERRLSSGAEPTSPTTTKPLPDDLPNHFDIAIDSPHGLHARPATALVDIAKEFDATIRVRHGDRAGDAKSLIALLNLGIGSGATIRVMAEGPDADAALTALREAIEAGLEEEEDAPVAGGEMAPIDWEGRSIAGVAASPGLAAGPAWQYQRGKIVVAATARDPSAELTRLDRAIEGAKRELAELYEEVKSRYGAGKAAIFRAHAEFLEDQGIIEAAKTRIRDASRSAGYAWEQSYGQQAKDLAAQKDALLAARAVDLRDVGRRVLRLLAERIEDAPKLPDTPVILVADDLSPSDTAKLDPALALGICTASGGPTSHTAIIARSLGIPALVGAGDSVLEIADGTDIVLDGNSGTLVLTPTDADRATAERVQADMANQREEERRACYQPAIMTDGARVEVVANIAAPEEAARAVEAGGEGVGLLRTEFLFLGRDQAPTEEEQTDAYTTMVEALNGLPIIIRTLDIGGDKSVPYMSMPVEENPFLGERGIRLCLNRPELFRTQLRAIFRASKKGPVRIMFPMISTLEELKRAKALTEEVRQEIGADPVEIGIMIEVPSAVMMAEELAAEADFFSVGSNDLTQYCLAIDRMHPMLSRQADGLHPAVLRMIDQTVKAAEKAGKWVGVCGGIAGDPRGVVILTGLGVKELSVSIPSIAAVKAQIRGLSMEKANDLAKRALACSNAAAVRRLR
ncbi:phosphoenolpyruvate-protein phosphotransferase [Thiorhodococcus drewsii AZ1]|uniref:Multiphosphoryl transfer protein n=1 Tax=Thiorhodococcus drewsii AZ1 TaxID=765913 RepID=G2DXW1_9GAMM|nr:phosphoenolpyruvate--protein phosphotransferase [Thiorhodococcus drewsii]EGV33160.1 phosphoenolpyruvate-protein phosphotransferase [Thiorhodococcus drewsii AZ1]